MSNSEEPVTEEPLPPNRFELELEFVQALASPAYIHFVATSRVDSSDGGIILQDPAFMRFLKYLRDTWTRPEYAKYVMYPHAFYFLNLLVENHSTIKEWSLVGYRDFCHQQQFRSWQYRHSTIYGRGTTKAAPSQAESQNPTAALEESEPRN